VSVCVFPFYLQYVDRNPPSATASLSHNVTWGGESKKRHDLSLTTSGVTHVCLGLEYFSYIP